MWYIDQFKFVYPRISDKDRPDFILFIHDLYRSLKKNLVNKAANEALPMGLLMGLGIMTKQLLPTVTTALIPLNRLSELLIGVSIVHAKINFDDAVWTVNFYQLIDNLPRRSPVRSHLKQLDLYELEDMVLDLVDYKTFIDLQKYYQEIIAPTFLDDPQFITSLLEDLREYQGDTEELDAFILHLEALLPQEDECEERSSSMSP